MTSVLSWREVWIYLNSEGTKARSWNMHSSCLEKRKTVSGSSMCLYLDESHWQEISYLRQTLQNAKLGYLPWLPYTSCGAHSTQELKRQAHIFIKCMYGGLGLGVILRTTVHFLSDKVSWCWRLLSRLGCWPVLQGRSSDSPVLGFQEHTPYQTQHFYMSSRELNSGP